MREVVSQTTVTFLSTFAIQVTTFVILALAAFVLPVSEFGRLSLIVATVMLSSAFFEFGLNITATKMYGDTRDEGYFRIAFAVRLMVVPVSFALGLITAFAGLPDIGLGIGLGALLNIWNGMRATDQAQQDYASFAMSSLTFAALRATFGLLALMTLKNPLLVAVAVYALPIAAVVLSKSLRHARHAFSLPLPLLDGTFRYAWHVYLNAITFIAIPYVPQFFIASRLDATAVGTYGLILMFVGPISLLVYSLRSVLLPKMLGSASYFEDMLWSWRGLGLIVTLWTALMVGGAVVAFGLGVAYGARFPQIEIAFLIFFFGFSGSAAVGFYSLSVHTRGVPGLASAIGFAKLLAMIPVVLISSSSLIGVVSAVATVMLCFEVLLALMLIRKGRA